MATIHQKIGPDYEEKIIRPAVRSVIRLVISEYPVMDVYSSKRAQIQDEINVKIKQLLEKDGFIIDEVVLRDVRFTEEFTKAIEAKQVAQQQVQTEQQILAQKQIQAQQAVAAAKGQADATVTLAEGQAKANGLLSASLTDQILQYQYIQKLTDKITVMLLPSGNQTIFDLKGLLGQATAP